MSEFDGIQGEIFRRKLMREYPSFVEYANEGFCMTKFHHYVTHKIQEFLEVRTENAFDILLLSVPPRHGKGAAKDTLVWTPDGWRRHGDLRVGDAVYSQSGEIEIVTQVHPDYCLDEYEVTFSTGEKVRVSPQHLWPVIYTDRSKKPVQQVSMLVETQDIFNRNRYLLERAPRIAVNSECDGIEQTLLIPPYILGLWLGDGYSHTGAICGLIDDLLEYNCGDIHIVPNKSDFGIVRPKELSMYNLRRYNLVQNKHIPVEYLTSPASVRRELLMGLLDTDGNISKNNCTCEICTKDKTLADDIYLLVRSLGYKAQFHERVTHNQNKDFEGKAYRIIWRPYDGDVLFRLKRKQTILDTYIGAPTNHASEYFYIRSVKKVRENVIGNCISVSGDGTYLITENLIPTHNSFMVTETLPAWYLGNNPRGEVIICSYQSTFAEGFSRICRDKFNRLAPQIWHVNPDKNLQRAELWATEQGGRCRAAGLDAGITGFGANIFIIDDPIKNAAEASSEAIIKKILGEMGPSVQSRIYPHGKLIVIQTRWVENDVVGFIKDNWSEFIWADINFPCEYDEEAVKEGPCPLGRHLGDSLMGPHLGDPPLPDKIANDNNWLRSKKMVVLAAEGQRVWNSLYQGRPTGATGNMFDETSFKKFRRDEFVLEKDRARLSPKEISARKRFSYMQLSIDATFKGEEENDFVAMGVRGIYEGDVYLYDQWNKRWSFTQTVQKIQELCELYPEIDELVIEDKANGPAIADVLRYTDGIPPVVTVNPLGGKQSRAAAVTPFVDAGHYHIAEDIPDEQVDWHVPTTLSARERIIAQFKSFPYGKHDDMVDEMSQGTIRLIKLVTGETPQPERRFIRYTKWYPDMWEDFERMTAAQQAQFIQTYGAPEEWRE